MKFCSFYHEGAKHFGLLTDTDVVVDLIEAGTELQRRGSLESFDEKIFRAEDLRSWLSMGTEALDAAAVIAEAVANGAGEGTYPRRQTRLIAPITNPRKIVAVGLNYRQHAEEQGEELPERPMLFAKFPSAVVGPDEPIKLPASSRKVDVEAELCAVVLGRCKRVDRRQARSLLAFTIGNDVSARDFQFSDRQWVRGKSCDTFAPLGPTIVTADELGDPHNLAISLRLNDSVQQESNTSDLIFDSYVLVEFISETITLEPGDLIYTGTPSGVGVFRDPPIFLKPGDVVEVSIEKLGTLRNPVVADTPSSAAK